MPTRSDDRFASDNTAGICPEAWSALERANRGRVPSYGEDAYSARAKQRFQDVFETACDVYFVFNGTAANSLALSAMAKSFQSVLCHETAHAHTDECGAPEFFTGGAKLVALPGQNGKHEAGQIEAALRRGHGVHSPPPAVLSLTQSTELGTLYSLEETRALSALAHANGLTVHMDGARFANAAAAQQSRGASPADLTWRAGVDVLCFGGSKNGLHTTEAVVFFNRPLSRHFEYRVKQGAQLASKMRFAAAQWDAVLADGAWLRHAGHANAQTRKLAEGLRAIPGVKLLFEPEVNGIFVEFLPPVYTVLEQRGWNFFRFIGDHGYRLMCAWDTTDRDVAEFLADVRAAK